MRPGLSDTCGRTVSRQRTVARTIAKRERGRQSPREYRSWLGASTSATLMGRRRRTSLSGSLAQVVHSGYEVSSGDVYASRREGERQRPAYRGVAGFRVPDHRVTWWGVLLVGVRPRARRILTRGLIGAFAWTRPLGEFA
jgi:hypothetical protein